MRRCSIPLAFLALSVLGHGAVGQEVRIPPWARVGNPDNRCFGAALEDCARALGMRSLYRVSDQFKGGTCFKYTSGPNGQRQVTYSRIDDVLGHRGWRKPDNYDETFSGNPRWLDDRIQAGLPIVVSLGSGHGVCLRKLTESEAIVVDNDGCSMNGHFYWANSDRRMSRQQFLRQWRVLGWAICLYREPGYYVPGPPYRVPNEDLYYGRYGR